MQVNFQGAIAEALNDIFMINDGYSAGEKVAQLEKIAGKRFYYLSDQEFYNATQEMKKVDYYTDTFYTEDEINQITVNEFDAE